MSDGTSEVTKAAFDVLVFQIKQLTEERDEARRIACELKTTNQQGRYSFAIIMGWDCYKEKA